ncbi:hypothetical protein M409DRAFT_26357 [Zasmidium cellare ATCC 36951]|uniref:DUF788 domain protein n=1 Tax=Zasmidium cellare ATCC 36951 TaxID=1080233 RepID=A0A6A6CAR8_ZASCE|nr:uncharacterized protein M409DRAFT_26357 [Zasmidium cellare ATCC 36951]KAF2163320.1 hypothetical protein M409DRAFT_26357 [Zasmidium cellare ATCC 36951]
MAQKAFKTLAQKNTQTLNRAHLIALGVNAFYLLFALLISRKRSLYKYILLNGPALVFEFWFERIGRPVYQDGELKRAGEDLEAKGLTEWMWDVVYWTWGNVVFVALAGDWAWWGMVVPVLYSVWSAWTTYTGVRQGMGGMMGGGDTDTQKQGAGGQSKRQAKMEKRGGQKMVYR